MEVVCCNLRVEGVAVVVVLVRDHVVRAPAQARRMLDTLRPHFEAPVVLLGDRAGGYFGPPDLVAFCNRHVAPHRIPWQHIRLRTPVPPSAAEALFGDGRPALAWTGASGRRYAYYVVPLGVALPDDLLGNYLVVRVENDAWIPLYVGEGPLADAADLDLHPRGHCLRRKGATHLHARPNPNPSARIAEETDVLLGNPRAFAPDGCTPAARS